MVIQAIRYFRVLALAGLLIAPQAKAIDAVALPAGVSEAMAQAASPQAIAEYHRKLREYQQAHGPIDAYWTGIADKRRGRNAKRREHQPITLDDYVLTQPPVYNGPPRPVDPTQGPSPPRERKAIPVTADLLAAAAREFQFTPQRPATEVEFKRAYARYALAAGLTREQAVRVYSFETGGTGTYDVQAGIEHGGKRAISSAIGYNQLLTTNSVEVMAEQGHEFVKELTAKATSLSGPARQAMDRKIAVLKKMLAFTRSVPDDWSAHEKLANTAQGWAVHAMVLDIDVGPLLQTHKLLTSVIFARVQGLYPSAHRRGTGNDEPDRRRHRARHGDDAARQCASRCRPRISSSARAMSATRWRSATTRWRNCSTSPTAAWTSNSSKPGAQELAAAF